LKSRRCFQPTSFVSEVRASCHGPAATAEHLWLGFVETCWAMTRYVHLPSETSNFALLKLSCCCEPLPSCAHFPPAACWPGGLQLPDQ
jgi:hypothetical protein